MFQSLDLKVLDSTLGSRVCGGNEKRKRCEDRTPWNTDVYGSAKEKAVVHSLWDAPQDCLLLLVPVCATRAEVMVRHC